jgi:hypothetical protein
MSSQVKTLNSIANMNAYEQSGQVIKKFPFFCSSGAEHLNLIADGIHRKNAPKNLLTPN